MEQPYQDAFSVEEETALDEPSQKAVTRQFLRGIPQAISSKLLLDYPTESCRNLAKQAHCIEEVLACTQTPVEQVTSVESTQKDSRLETLSSELNELKCFFKGRLTLSSQKMLKFSQSHNLLLGGQHPRSVFLVDLPHIFIGTAAAHLLSGEEGVAKAASTVAELMVKEEPKHVLPVLIVEVWVMWPVSVPRHI